MYPSKSNFGPARPTRGILIKLTPYKATGHVRPVTEVKTTFNYASWTTYNYSVARSNMFIIFKTKLQGEDMLVSIRKLSIKRLHYLLITAEDPECH